MTRSVFRKIIFLLNILGLLCIFYIAAMVFDFFGPANQCSCYVYDDLKSNTQISNMFPGHSYDINNKFPDRYFFDKSKVLPKAYIYNDIEIKSQNNKLKFVKNKCNMPKIIGEIYPGDFSYKDFVNGFKSYLFLGDNSKIYSLDFEIKARCEIDR